MRFTKFEGGRLFPPDRIIFIARVNSEATSRYIYNRFSKYGRVLALDRCREKGYCTLLFDSETNVDHVVRSENQSVLIDRAIDVRPGNRPRYFFRLPENLDDLDIEDDSRGQEKPYRQPRPERPRRAPRQSKYERSLEEEYDRYADVPSIDDAPSSLSADQPPPTECVILALKSPSVVYVKQVEQEIRDVGLTVCVKTPRPEIGVDKTLEEMKIAGVQFAVIVHSSNEQRRTVSLNVLHTSSEDEHRNIPLSQLSELLNSRLQQRFEQLPQLPLPPAGLKQLRMAMQGRPLTGLERDHLIRLLLVKRDYVQKQMSQSAVSSRLTSSADIVNSAVSALPAALQLTDKNKMADHVSKTDDALSVLEMSPDTLELQQRILNIMVQLGLSETA